MPQFLHGRCSCTALGSLAGDSPHVKLEHGDWSYCIRATDAEDIGDELKSLAHHCYVEMDDGSDDDDDEIPFGNPLSSKTQPSTAS